MKAFIEGKEYWADIEGYEGQYQISNFGRVRSVRQSTIRKPNVLKSGYEHMTLYRGGKNKTVNVHRLVAEAFIANVEGKPVVNHINGNPHDNRLENLEWATYSENSRHAAATGLIKSGGNSALAKLTDEQARYVRDNPDKLTQAQLAQKFGVTAPAISFIQRGKTYRNAGGKIVRLRRGRTPRGCRSNKCGGMSSLFK